MRVSSISPLTVNASFATFPRGVGGHIFPDDSCFHGATEEAARAGWSAVQLNDLAELLRWIQGPIPRDLPKTAATVEHF
eukprot:255484-Pyramimonas_sp.AAC.1